MFNKENTLVEHIKAIDGRYIIITFFSPEVRNETLKEDWLSIWFENINPWSGVSAKEERFVWLSCYGFPLNGWPVPNFKLIGDCWGEFLKVDEPTLHGDSFERGRILIASEQSQRISGTIQLEILGLKYYVRVEEDDSFRTINFNSLLTQSTALKSEFFEDKNATAHTNAMVENVVEVVEKDEDVAMSAELAPNNDKVDELEVEIVDETPVENRTENKVDVVDESPDKLIIEEVVAEHNATDLQMMVFKPLSMPWKKSMP